MKKVIKKIVPQNIINNFYHLPKAIMANIFYGFPTRKLIAVGVTGTDGKSTTVNMIYQILKEANKKVSMISSINACVGGKTYDTGFHVSSPDPFAVQRLIKKALEHEDEYLILEVTSHGLDQYRFWGIKFEVGVITNITHDHLDYHKTFEDYFQTKLKLIKNSKFAIVNQAINRGTIFRRKIKTNHQVITFGLSKGDFNQQDIKLKLKILGDYNLENALASLAVAFALNIDRKVAQKALEKFSGVSGRMEQVANKRGIKIFIDFASTPNALEQALKALRSQTKGRLISVFGSASERDVMKRPMMGEISGRLADITILTDEDPRFESSHKIIAEIAQGAKRAGVKDGINLFQRPDRAEAIKLAISLAREGDTVGIFGKGHERSISYKGVEKPWSDREAVKKVLNG